MECISIVKCVEIFSFRLLSLFFLFIALASTQSINDTSTNSTTNSTQSNVTVISPFWLGMQNAELDRFMIDRYNYYVTSKGNKVWSCAMNLAWNQMKRQFLMGKNATFKNPTNLQQKIVDNFNSEQFTRDQISDKTYYVGSGYGLQAQNKINFQVKEKFPNKKFSQLKHDLKQKDFIIYTYFNKAFQFKTPFSQCTSFKFKGQRVQAFQSLSKKQRKQLYYKYYNNQDDFLMGIETANNNDQILLLKTNLTQFQNIRIEKIEKWIEMYSQLPNKKLKYFDEFKMPVLNFEYIRELNEMNGLIFNNTQINQSKIDIMQQRLQFKLNRFGVQMTNDAVIVIYGIAFFLDTKYFYLNKDFWLILKEKNKKPYLIINVKSVNEVWSAQG